MVGGGGKRPSQALTAKCTELPITLIPKAYCSVRTASSHKASAPEVIKKTLKMCLIERFPLEGFEFRDMKMH